MPQDAGKSLFFGTFKLLMSHMTFGSNTGQGMSAEKLMVGSWSYTFKNWVYVVLSRVTKLSGLYLSKPFDATKEFPVDQDLVDFERTMTALQEHVLTQINLSDAPNE